MNCEMCGSNDRHEFALLPIKQPDGRLESIICLECAQKSPAYCSRHGQPHMGFMDETTACRTCIDELVTTDGERIAGLLIGAISKSLMAAEIQSDIDEWLEMIGVSLPQVGLADLELAVKFIQTPRALNISRAVFTKSQRSKVTPEEVIEKVASEGAMVIIPKLEF